MRYQCVLLFDMLCAVWVGVLVCDGSKASGRGCSLTPLTPFLLNAVPFEEDLKNPLIWYLDHNYLESMFYMFKKINGELMNL